MTDNSKQATYNTYTVRTEIPITLRQYFAGKAMEGLVREGGTITIKPNGQKYTDEHYQQRIAEYAVTYADALLKALEENHE